MLHRSSCAATVCLVIMLFGISFLSGCTAARAPQIVLGEARLVDTTAEAVRFDLSVELTNPNPEPVSLHAFEYRVAIDGRDIYSGRRSAETTLGAGGSRQLQLPVVAPLDAISHAGGGQITMVIVGDLEYVSSKSAAAVRQDLGLDLPRVSFSGRCVLQIEADALSDTAPR